ncbi:DNA polymerase III subunit beta [Halothermothrix orenii]|uniref:Beta sliding clamp n=1 Tax=Halothermothrix orenii (strain H 168 / OCM 544 / DSM 9562) TaxID=373903 RepID=B8CZN5_HALOH|nr:DNA polymerase III subunit beta [Halothermothrix orenii]ACL68765.1 DNA polymerase III, beta subunit [Halothermothrix orenii H 168]
MEFTISQKDFSRSINIVQRAVSSKNTMPILTGIYLEARKDKGLHMKATDLELGIEYWVKADIITEGKIVLPASHLSGIIRELPDDNINFKADLDKYEAELTCLSSRFKIKGFDADEFPQLPEVNIPHKITLNCGDLNRLIDEVKFSTSTDQTQPALTGGSMVIDSGKIRMVATNTYRLSLSSLDLDGSPEGKKEVILPGNTLSELSHLLDDDGEVEILIGDNYVRFNFNGIVLVSRVIEGQFPNYQQVLPKEYNTKVRVDRNNLLRSVRRVSLIARLDSNVISISVKDNKMIITSQDSEEGFAREEIEIESQGPEQNINIDAGYLLDVLKVLNDDVVILELIGPLNPLTLKKENSDDFIYLVMPVRR